MTAVRRVRDLARSTLPRSVGERLPAAPPQEVTELLHDARFQSAVAAFARVRQPRAGCARSTSRAKKLAPTGAISSLKS